MKFLYSQNYSTVCFTLYQNVMQFENQDIKNGE